METVKDVGQVISQVGVPAALILVMVFGAWRGLQWVGEQILLPLLNAALQFLKTLETNLEAQTILLRSLEANSNEQAIAMRNARCLYTANHNLSGGP
jgi:hypothetical protein